MGRRGGSDNCLSRSSHREGVLEILHHGRLGLDIIAGFLRTSVNVKKLGCVQWCRVGEVN